MNLASSITILLIDLLLGIGIGWMAARRPLRRWLRGDSARASPGNPEQSQCGPSAAADGAAPDSGPDDRSVGQCQQELMKVEEQLIRHNADLESFLAAAEECGSDAPAVDAREELAKLKQSNELTSRVLGTALAEWPRRLRRFGALLATELQRLTQYCAKTSQLNRTIEDFEGSATLESLVQIMSAATEELRQENRDLREQLILCQQQLRDEMAHRESAEEQARIDALTRLPNRRAFDERIAQLQAQYERNGCDYALVLFDLDHFKTLNDVHGHRTGDAVLAMVAQILRDCCRMPDQVSRYGGEEFALLVPGCTGGRAGWLAERCRFRIEIARLRFAGQELHITVSAGVAQVAASRTTADLVARADAALYEAKQAGRNCVRVDGETKPHVRQLVR